jgi:hypothetical protein
MLRSFKHRLFPNPAQAAGLTDMLGSFCDLYNACLQQRIEAYRRQGRSPDCVGDYSRPWRTELPRFATRRSCFRPATRLDPQADTRSLLALITFEALKSAFS